jgi:hypothetical protein
MFALLLTAPSIGFAKENENKGKNKNLTNGLQTTKTTIKMKKTKVLKTLEDVSKLLVTL